MSKVRLETILLGVLLQHPQTGYELQRFMEATGRFWRANTSMTQVYRTLRKMDDDGWLEHDVEPRLGAQDAKRYRVAPAGRDEFFAWLNAPHRPAASPTDPGFEIRLRFTAQFLGRASVVALLDREIEHRVEQIKRNRDRDRVEIVDPRAPIDIEFAGAIANWQHLRGAARMDAHLGAVVDLRDLLLAGESPADDLPNPLVCSDEPLIERRPA